MDIRDLLARPEGKRLEYERDLSSPASVMRALTAFANSAGGVLIFGVDDDRTVLGVDDPLLLESRLVNMISDRIAPRLVPEIDIVPWRSTQLVVIQVHLSSSRPHRVISDNQVYVRLGASNRKADAELIEEMRRSCRFESFDETAFPTEPLDQIDIEALASEFASVRVIDRENLGVLGLSVEHQGREVPTVGGLVLFGHDRVAFPDASIRCARFAGTTRSTIADTIDLVGSSLPRMVRDALSFVDRNSARAIVIDGLANVVLRPVPVIAVREALVNAVVHADYSQRGGPIRVAMFDDRLEIENPGLLPSGMTVEDMWTGVSRVRNRVIARVFKELGYIEQWGSGIGRMLEALHQAGLARPLFEELGGRFRVTLWTGESGSPVLTDDERRLINALRTAGSAGLPTSELTEILGRSARTTRTRMARLVELGLVFQIGSGPTDPHRRYVAAKS
jgi:ATP-dependent DNA helicase RecG